MNNSITYVNSKRSCLLIALSLLWCFELHAAPPAPLPNVVPQGAKVAAGVANVSSGGTRSAPVLNVNQSSQRAVVDWNTFNVGKDATVNFNQPNANASTLNRISDPNPSAIHGKINAPGEVVLVNPAGVYIGKNASLDVGAVVATTHNVKNDDYMAGSPKYERNGARVRS
jgi:filamentous hemagglutinin family protein